MRVNNPQAKFIILYGHPKYCDEDAIYCENCGRDITDENIFKDDNFNNLCEECLMELHLKDGYEH